MGEASSPGSFRISAGVGRVDMSMVNGNPVGPIVDGGTSLVLVNDRQTSLRPQAVAREIGALLIVSGIAGILLPGPVGTPLLVMGCVMVWPRAFRPLQRLFERQFPRTHHIGAVQYERFLSDLERRYPVSR